LTLDTTRVDRLGCYGYTEPTSPHLDALAARGARFEQAIAPLALTRPSHATMFTGLLPHNHGVWSNGPYRLEPGMTTLTGRLRQAGFETAAVVASFVLARAFGFGRDFAFYDDSTREIQGGDPEKTAPEVRRVAAEWLRSRARSPFFLWLHFYDPHYPYSPPEPFGERFPSDPYDGEIAALDAAIGGVLEALDKKGWLEETLVVAVADHGEGLGERSETTHGYLLYDNTVRVPMIFAGPGVPAGTVVAQQVTLADLLPTLLDAFRLTRPSDHFDGRSLWRELQQGSVSDRPALLENRAVQHQFGWATIAGIRAGGWKWLRAPEPELYNLVQDSQETRNLASLEVDRAAELARLWKRLRPAVRRQTESALTAEEERRLASLGYLSSRPRSSTSGAGPDPKDVAVVIPAIEGLIAARRDRQTELVASFIDTILSRDPTNLFALRLQGERLVESRQFAEAVELLRPIVEGHETHPEAQAFLASAYEGLGETDHALRWYQRATTPPWIHWPALRSLARISMRYPELLPRGTLLRKLEPFRPGAARERLELARAYALLGEQQQAVGWFSKALRADPDLTEARVGLAQVQIRQGQLEQALVTLRSVQPPTVESTYVLGSALAEGGNAVQACSEFRTAMDMAPRNVNLLLGLGRRLTECRETDLALEAYLLALGREPDHPQALFESARLYDHLGTQADARRQFEHFLAVAPAELETQRAHASKRLRGLSN
jgi:arylsulfatase A-like enzyme/tetratricopeptide (TPR) repeat protein